MVEWLLCKQHVAGSNPTTSTSVIRVTRQQDRRKPIDVSQAFLFFENRELEIKENYNSYTRRNPGRVKPPRGEEEVSC